MEKLKQKCWKTIVNDKQLAWVYDKTKSFNIITMSVHGSHLYGVDRVGSDVDIKAVYIPTFKDLLYGDSIKTYNYKNKDLDVEIELKSLPSFLKSAKSCDTNCVDLLHTPKHLRIATSDVWESLIMLRSCLYSKGMRGLVGYIKTHSHKYSHKIQRYDEMSELLTKLLGYDMCERINNTDIITFINNRDFKYIKIDKNLEHGYLDVCGKKYLVSRSVQEVVNALEKETQRYGSRTLSGSDSGMDSKSLSHALRVLYELEEILTTRDLKFPLENREIIKSVKLGECNIDEVLKNMDLMFDKVIKLLDTTDLPNTTDITPMLIVLEKYYKELLK